MANPPGYPGKSQAHDHQITLDETGSITKQNKTTKQNHGCGKVQGGERDDESGGKKTKDKNETNGNASHTRKKLSENRFNQ